MIKEPVKKLEFIRNGQLPNFRNVRSARNIMIDHSLFQELIGTGTREKANASETRNDEVLMDPEVGSDEESDITFPFFRDI